MPIKRNLIYFFLPIILAAGGWGVFNQYIRPNHYHLLYPYSTFSFRDSVITETRLGADNKIEIKIPAGYTKAGKTDYEEYRWVQEFWIDQIPVTAAEYKKYLSECSNFLPRYRNEYLKYWDEKVYELLPVVFVSWGQAEDYCEFYGGHLPAEMQWEKAARGPDGTILYWNDSKKAYNKANYDDFYSGKTFSGWLPAGKTHYGLIDMSGNVREWVLDWLYEPNQPVDGRTWKEIRDSEPSEYGKILKGGSYFDDVSHLRLYNRDYHDPYSPGLNRGFRCVYEK